MANKKLLPKIEYIRKRLEYFPKTGRIVWRSLEASDFPGGYTSPAMQAVDHNRSRAGRDAETLDRRGKGIVISVAGMVLEPARVAWALHYGEWPDNIVDHIDSDHSNNKLDNLRLATVAENNRNRTSVDGTSSKYLGVTKVDKKWQAQIKHNGGVTYLGRFDSEESAAIAYDCAAIVMHREFANPNIVRNPFLT